jgi:ketosteroid isomerase-like protein
MTGFVPEAFARDWVDAWNRSDADAVLAHYADDAVFVSPLAARVTGNAEVRGKAALGAYWRKALGLLTSPLRFALESFSWDEKNRAFLVVYVSSEADHSVRKCELMHFSENGLICRGESFTGAAADSTQPGASPR